MSDLFSDSSLDDSDRDPDFDVKQCLSKRKRKDMSSSEEGAVLSELKKCKVLKGRISTDDRPGTSGLQHKLVGSEMVKTKGKKARPVDVSESPDVSEVDEPHPSSSASDEEQAGTSKSLCQCVSLSMNICEYISSKLCFSSRWVHLCLRQQHHRERYGSFGCSYRIS